MEEDLAGALEGLDPLELLLHDPELASVALDVFQSLEGRSVLLEEAGDSCRFEEVLDGQDQERHLLSPDQESPQSNLPAASPSWSSGVSTASCSSSSPSHSVFSSDDTAGSVDGDGKKGKANNHRSVANAFCAACGRPARGYRYFGAVVCNSCRAFFSRATKGDAHIDFLCRGGDGRCAIDSRSWSTCQKCRFARCLEVGMRPTNGTKGEEKPQVKEGRAERSYVDEYTQKTRKLLAVTSSLTLEEKLSVEEIVSKHMNQGCVNFCKLIHSNMGIFTAFLDVVFYGRRYPIRLQKQTEDFMVFAAGRDFAEDSPGWYHLGARDKARLTAANFPLASEFLTAYKLGMKSADGELELERNVVMFMEAAKEEMDRDFCRTIDELYRKARQNGKIQEWTYELAYDREELLIPAVEESSEKGGEAEGGGGGGDLLKEHRRAADRIAELTEQQDWDPVHLMLTLFVILFSPDFLELDDPGEVERIQTAYACLLQR